jgi:hypothetical protein
VRPDEPVRLHGSRCQEHSHEEARELHRPHRPAKAEKAKEPPTVFTDIELVYRVTGSVNHKSMEDAVRLSKEKYCSVSAMLEKTAKITYTIEYADA